jgi:HK97 family phage portal protein
MRMLQTIKRGLDTLTLPFYGPGGTGGSWFWRNPSESVDYRKEVTPLHLNSIVAIGIQRATSMWSSAPPLVQRRVADSKEGNAVWEGVSGHWAELLFDYPADYYTSTNFWAGTLIGWMTEGECFIFAPIMRDGARPFLSILPGWQVTPKSDIDNPDGRALITYYEYRTVGGVTINIPAEWIIHIRQGFNPINQARGWCALQAQYPHVYGDNKGGIYTAGLLANFGVPSITLIKTDQSDITIDQLKTLRESVTDRFSGEGAGRPMLVPFPVKLEKTAFSPQEMSLKELATAPLERICPALGFDPMALGLPSQSKTYSNMEEANRAAWRQTIRPWKEEIGRQLTKAFFGRQSGGPGDYRIWWDFDSVPELAEDKDKLHQRVREDYKANLYPSHQALSLLKLPIEGIDNVFFSDRQAKANDKPGAGVALRAAVRTLLGSEAFDEDSI